METKIAKYIESEKNITKEVKIFLQDNGNRDYCTVKDLMEQLEEDRQYNIKQGTEEEYLNTPVTLQLVDIEGQNITGKCCLAVGQLVDGLVLITGNIDSVDFLKED